MKKYCARCGAEWLIESLRIVLRQYSRWRFKLVCPTCWPEIQEE